MKNERVDELNQTITEIDLDNVGSKSQLKINQSKREQVVLGKTLKVSGAEEEDQYDESDHE